MTTPDPDSNKSGDGYDPQMTTYVYDSAGRLDRSSRASIQLACPSCDRSWKNACPARFLDRVIGRLGGVRSHWHETVIRLEWARNLMPDRLRVLLADDEESDRVFAQRASRNASTPHVLRAVADGQQAIDYLLGLGDFSDRAQFPLPHLLLLDLNMPRRTGFDVLQWLREENQLRNLPVVVLSASGLERDVTRAYELGANAYMIKPTGLTDFQQSFSLIVAYWHRITTTVRLAT